MTAAYLPILQSLFVFASSGVIGLLLWGAYQDGRCEESQDC